MCKKSLVIFIAVAIALSAHAATIDVSTMGPYTGAEAGNVALYHLDNSLADSANGFDMTGIFNSGYVAGKFNQAMDSPGNGFAGREVGAGNNEDHFGLANSDWSVEAWFNPATAAQNPYATVIEMPNTEGIRLGYDPTGTVPWAQIFIANVGPVALTGTTTPAAGEWHHLAVTRDISTGEIILYLDGVAEDSGIFWPGNALYGGSPTYTWPLLVGGPVYWYNGLVDEVRFSNTLHTFVPEPATMILLLTGAVFLRRRNRS